MSKEDWIRAYELNLDDGMSEEQAVAQADERATDLMAAKIDDAMNRMKEQRYEG